MKLTWRSTFWGFVNALMPWRGPKVKSLPRSAGACSSAIGGRHVVCTEPDWPRNICLLCAQLVDAKVVDPTESRVLNRPWRLRDPK